jgi:hypothetical protein
LLNFNLDEENSFLRSSGNGELGGGSKQTCKDM